MPDEKKNRAERVPFWKRTAQRGRPRTPAPGESFPEDQEVSGLEREYEQVDSRLFLSLESKKETSDEIHWRQVQGEEVDEDLQSKWRKLNREVEELERRKQKLLQALDEKTGPGGEQAELPVKSVISFFGMAREGRWVPAGIVTALILITAWAVWYYSEPSPLLPGKLAPRGAGRQAGGDSTAANAPLEPAAPASGKPEESPDLLPEPAKTPAADRAAEKPREKAGAPSEIDVPDTPPPPTPFENAASYRKKKKYKNAEEIYRGIIQSGPEPGRAYYELGEMYLEQGLYQRAKEMFGKSARYYEENVTPE